MTGNVDSNISKTEGVTMTGHAEISACGQFRYLLERSWAPLLHLPTLVVCMLNPSKADAEVPDPTVGWLVGWAKPRGYGSLRIVNMAAYRNKSPAVMLAATDPHGPENTSYLIRYCAGKEVLCAWGNTAVKLPRYAEMLAALGDAKLMCLTTTKSGSPAHPLRKSHKLELSPWIPS